MRLQEIRERTNYTYPLFASSKDVLGSWLSGQSTQYPYALTLTLKQTVQTNTALGSVNRSLKREDCVRIARRFQQKLNRQVFGKRAAESYGKALRYMVVLEGERSDKRLHLHMAIGAVPRYITPKAIAARIAAAKQLIVEIDTQYKVDIADSGWLEYIAKEATRNDTDNVLWELCN
jgi:hypothetical protein